MTQYLLCNTDSDSDNARVGLTSDQLYEGGVLGGDNYRAAETSRGGYLELSANSEYVAIDSFLNSSTITGMTVMAWVRSTDTSGEAYISSHDRSEYYRFNLNGGDLDVSFDINGGGGDHNSGVFVADGKWHHLAAVYDAGEVRMYVDGRRVYTDTGYPTEIGSGKTRYGFLGAASEASSFDGDTNANAGIYDISDHRLYLDAKTDTEVKAAFEGNPPTAGLHEYLPLTTDDDGRLNDASGNNRDGFLRNGASIYGSDSPTTFENAENNDLSDWTVNEGTLSVDNVQAIDNFSLRHEGFGGDDGAREAVKPLDNPSQIDSFSFMFWETSSNTSAALSFYNSNGNREFSVGTNNPQWAYDDASGNDRFGNGDYRNWTRFTINFDWFNSEYTVTAENTVDGNTASHTGKLYEGVDIAEISSGQVGLTGYTGVGQWNLDEMYVNPSVTTTFSEQTLDTSNTASASPTANTQPSSLTEQLAGGTTNTTLNAIQNTLTSTALTDSGLSTTTAGRPKNWWATAGYWAGDANLLGSVDGFNEVAEFDATTNSSFEDIFTNRFFRSDWPAYSGDGRDVYLAFAAKWNEIPFWGRRLDGEWIKKPSPDPNQYQLYILRSDGAGGFNDSEYFRIYYADSSDTAQGRVADPHVWLDWGDQQWGAQIVGDSSSRTVEPTTQQQFTHADQFASLDTSAAVSAFVEQFDTVQLTGLTDALTGVTGDTTVVTTQTTRTLENALAEPLVASEQASLTVQDSTNAASVYADLLATNAFTDATTAFGSTAVTSLGQLTNVETLPQFDKATIEVFAFISPTGASASELVGAGDTDVSALALTENAFMVPLTPTLDIVVAVEKGETGIEGALADSLSASVGANTSITVAKTRGDADTFETTVTSKAMSTSVRETATLLSQQSTEFTDTATDALLTAALLNSVGNSSAASQTFGEQQSLATATQLFESVSDASPTGDVSDAVLDTFDTTELSSVTADGLADAANGLVQSGVAETQTEAAAIVANVVGKRLRSSETTSVTPSAELEAFEQVTRTSLGDASGVSAAAAAAFNMDSIDTSLTTEALPSVAALLVSTLDLSSEATAAATSVGDITGVVTDQTAASLVLLFAALRGENSVTLSSKENTVALLSGQHTTVRSGETFVKILSNNE